MYKTLLTIDGMACPMCEAHINDAVRGAFPVKKVSSSHKKGQTEILSEVPPDETALRAAIEKTGYHVLSYTAAPFEKKKFSLFGKK